MQTVRTELIANYAGLQRRIRELRREGSATLVFRGQTELRRGKLVPSLRRRTSADYLRLYDSLGDKAVARLVFGMMEEYLEWKRSGEGSPDESTADADAARPRGTIESVLRQIFQHYGGRSPYLDVTASLNVALWFAHHVFRTTEVPLLPMDLNVDNPASFEPMPVYAVAWYEQAWNENRSTLAYLFVLAPNIRPVPGLPNRHGDFFNLLPDYWSMRITRQKAGLIYADGAVDAGDLRHFVERIFRFALPLAGAPAS